MILVALQQPEWFSVVAAGFSARLVAHTTGLAGPGVGQRSRDQNISHGVNERVRAEPQYHLMPRPLASGPQTDEAQ